MAEKMEVKHIEVHHKDGTSSIFENVHVSSFIDADRRYYKILAGNRETLYNMDEVRKIEITTEQE